MTKSWQAGGLGWRYVALAALACLAAHQSVGTDLGVGGTYPLGRYGRRTLIDKNHGSSWIGDCCAPHHSAMYRQYQE